MRCYVFLAIFTVFSICANAQKPTAQDARGAIPVCDNVYTEPSPYNYSGEGNYPNEILKLKDCYTEELNGVWYTFTAQSDGYLKFTIKAKKADNEDYDWIVFDLTSTTSSELALNPEPYVLSSNNYGDFKNNQFTGADSDKVTSPTSGNCNGPGIENGSPFNEDIPVKKGNIYAMYVSNWMNSNAGYDLDFTESTAEIFDQQGPFLLKVETLLTCKSQNSFKMQMSENALCSSIHPEDFTLIGPNGQIPITNITSPDCNVEAPYSRNFIVHTELPLENGSYVLQMPYSVIDLCGNSSEINEIEFLVSYTDIQATYQTSEITCHAPRGSITIEAEGGRKPYKYSLDNGVSNSTNPVFQNRLPNTYKLVVTDVIGCTLKQDVELKPAKLIEITHVETSEIKCFGGKSTLEITATGGVGALSYSIDNGNTIVSENRFTNLQASSYSLVVLDAIGCKIHDNITIREPEEITIDIQPQALRCYEDNSGLINYSILGGVGDYTIRWTNSTNTTIPTPLLNLPADEYTVQITDENNCISTNKANIPQPDEIMVDIQNQPLKCFGDKTDIEIIASGGTGNLTYSIDDGNTHSPENIFTDLGIGTYKILVEDANHCTFQQETNITQPEELAIDIQTQEIKCFGDKTELEINVTGGTGERSYSIDGGNTNFPENKFTDLVAATYNIWVIDANNCQAQKETTILEPEEITVDTQTKALTCFESNDGQITNAIIKGGVGKYVVNWVDSENTPVLPPLENLRADEYTVEITDENNCKLINSINITQPDQLQIKQLTTSIVDCFGGATGAISFNPTGGKPAYRSLLTNTKNEEILLENYDKLVADQYTLSVSDANNCTSNERFTIAQNSDLSITPTLTHVKCNGGSTGAISLTIMGGTPEYTTTWHSGEIGFERINIPAGEYTANVTDILGCNKPIIVTITEPDALKVNLSPQHIFCHGASDGSIDIDIMGAQTDLLRKWTTQSGDPIKDPNANPQINLWPDIYHIEIIDQLTKLCAEATTEVTQPEDLLLSYSATPEICNNKAEGQVILEIKGGVTPYSEQWEFNESLATLDLTALSPGRYKFTLADKHNCKEEIEFEILNKICDPVIEIPNIFTPNGDGNNDYFTFKSLGYVDHFRGVILNRWGHEVFTWHEGDPGWNGILRSGNKATSGTYFYLITFTGGDTKTYQYKGYFTLHRD